jgi:TRAP-type mannitol/chloroaromatic compound transport system substrate-binding protein/uncharacterized caspase-like protein
MLRAVIALLVLILLPPTASAAKRVALVVGNASYTHAEELANPRNDAADISAALKRFGFQVVEGIDLDKTAFDRKIRDFAVLLQGAEVGLFFYAGHGLQVAGQNYLVPVDAQLTTASALDFEMVRLDLVHRTMEREAQTNIIFLDACRNNPLERNLRRAMGTRSADIGRGLAAVESGVGTLISFSTQPGNVAADGTGRNSPFAGALVRQLAISNEDLGAILIAVRNDVMRESQRRQVPWEHSALTGRFYFRDSPQASAPPPAAPAQSQATEAERAWAFTKDTTDVAVLEAFAARFKDTFYADLARARLAELKRQSIAAVPPAAPPPATAPVPSAAAPRPSAPAGRPKPAELAAFTVPSPLALKLQDTFPSSDASSRDPLNDVIRTATSLSGGKLKVDLLAAGSVAPAFQTLDAVHSGVLDAAWTVPAYWYGTSRAFGLVSGAVPMGLGPAAFVRWIEAEGAAESNRLISEVGRKKVRAMACGLQAPGGEWFKKPVRQIGDFKGLKIRMVGLAAEVGREIGAAVSVLPGGEIVPAMDRGLIDASDWSATLSAIHLGLPHVAKYLHYPGAMRPIHLLELIIGEPAWDKLGPSGQAGIEAVCRQNLQRSLERIPALEQQGLTEARRQGVTVAPYPPAVLAAMRQAAQRVFDGFARQDPDFARVLASYSKYR